MKFQKISISLLALLSLSKGVLAAEPIKVGTCPSLENLRIWTENISERYKWTDKNLTFQLLSVVAFKPKFTMAELVRMKDKVMMGCVYNDGNINISALSSEDYILKTCYIKAKGASSCTESPETCILYCEKEVK